MANKTKNGKTAEADQSSSGDEEFVADFSSPEGEGTLAAKAYLMPLKR